MKNIIFKTHCDFSIANLQQKVRLPGDINKMIFDMSDINLEKDKEELMKIKNWLQDIESWIWSYQAKISNLQQTPIKEGPYKHHDERNKIEQLQKYTDKIERAREAEKEALIKHRQKREEMENSVDRQKEFHKWGYTKTNSQSSQNSHNPFKIN